MDIDQDITLYAQVVQKPEGVFRDPAAVHRLRQHILRYHGGTPAQLEQAMLETRAIEQEVTT